MKYIQAIDNAWNCSYSISAASDEDFKSIFPDEGQDVEFVEDLAERLGNKLAGKIVVRATSARVEKQDLAGLHGTLFFGLLERKKLYPHKRESDLDTPDLATLLAGGDIKCESKDARIGTHNRAAVKEPLKGEKIIHGTGQRRKKGLGKGGLGKGDGHLIE